MIDAQGIVDRHNNARKERRVNLYKASDEPQAKSRQDAIKFKIKLDRP
jgi:hypothetical protein